MSRDIPIALAGHYAGRVTSLCRLIKVKCKDGTIIGFTTLDADVTYTDGPDGPITYAATNGAAPSAMMATADMSVDNAEMSGGFNAPSVTEQQVRSGLFNFARWWMFEINYLDTSMGHVLKASGTLGETTFDDLSWVVELRSKTQQLKQPMVDSYTLPCRVDYGSAACGKTLEWAEGVVASVDTDEPDRIFTMEVDIDHLDSPAYTLGVVRVTSGDNDGAEVEIEIHDGQDITLLLPLPYPLAEGDTFDIRIDCNKEARDNVHGCLSELRWGDDWVRHHRGFPDIPLADATSLQVPGAQTPSVPGTGIPSQQQ